MEKLYKELKGFCKSKGLEEREAAYLLGLFSKHIQALSQPSVSGSKNSWICVKDRLPNHAKDVFIRDATRDNYYGVGSYRKNVGWVVNGNNYWQPTHWWEVPE